jgi:hypothetical protein
MKSLNNDQYLVPEEEFFERINSLMGGTDILNISFFETPDKISSVKSKNMTLIGDNSGHFISNTSSKIRLDKIVTLNGLPGPAFTIYENFMNACLACEDLGQF